MENSIIFAIGFIASFFGSFTSSGASLLSFTFLGLYGLSPFTILGVIKVGSIGFNIGGLYNYARADKIVWKYVVIFTFIGSIGAYIGTAIVLNIDEALFSKIIGIAMLLCVPLTLLKPSLGVTSQPTGKKKRFLGYCMYALTSVWGSSIVIGAGIMNMFSQLYFFGLTILEVKGTAKIPNLVRTAITLALFIGAGIINWPLALAFLGGAFFGSLVGTYYSVKVGDTWLRYILLSTVLVVALKLILF